MKKLPVLLVILISLGIILLVLAWSGKINPDIANILVHIGAGLLVGAVFLWIGAIIDPNDNKRLTEHYEKEISNYKTMLKAKELQQCATIVHTNFAGIDLAHLIKDAKERVKFFLVSGRHLFTPQMAVIITKKIENQNDKCKISILAMDSMGERNFVKDRDAMMDIAGVRHHYSHDLTNAREVARQLSEIDPEHKKFDMRFYTRLPTTFFVIIDNRLYISFLLCKPVSECPVFEIDLLAHSELGKAFLNHFDFYWEQSRYYVSVIGFDLQKNKFVLVYNKIRKGLEYPSGYIEPAEDPKASAIREFREETGLEITNVQEVKQTPFGIYYCGIVGKPMQESSAREVGSVQYFDQLPDAHKLSFDGERDLFEEVLKRAKNILGIH